MSNFDAIQAAVRGDPPPTPISGLAVASIALGALTILPAAFMVLLRPDSGLALLLYYLLVGAPAVLAMVFGFVANGPTKRGERRGHGLAQWGSVMGFIALIAPYIAVLIASASAMNS